MRLAIALYVAPLLRIRLAFCCLDSVIQNRITIGSVINRTNHAVKQARLIVVTGMFGDERATPSFVASSIANLSDAGTN